MDAHTLWWIALSGNMLCNCFSCRDLFGNVVVSEGHSHVGSCHGCVLVFMNTLPCTWWAVICLGLVYWADCEHAMFALLEPGTSAVAAAGFVHLASILSYMEWYSPSFSFKLDVYEGQLSYCRVDAFHQLWWFSQKLKRFEKVFFLEQSLLSHTLYTSTWWSKLQNSMFYHDMKKAMLFPHIQRFTSNLCYFPASDVSVDRVWFGFPRIEMSFQTSGEEVIDHRMCRLASCLQWPPSVGWSTRTYAHAYSLSYVDICCSMLPEPHARHGFFVWYWDYPLITCLNACRSICATFLFILLLWLPRRERAQVFRVVWSLHGLCLGCQFPKAQSSIVFDFMQPSLLCTRQWAAIARHEPFQFVEGFVHLALAQV